MAEEFEDGAAGSPRAAATADGIALGSDARTGHLDPRAATYLVEQAELARLQKQNLVEQNAFELSHLRWRRFNDQMRGAMQIMIVALGALIVIAIVAAMWNAGQADGIVVEAFSAPPDFSDDGIGGDVVAGDITNKIAVIRDTANGNSFARSKDVHQEGGDDVKVEIPQTGISLDQAWRILKAWLGHERPLRGNLRRLADGRIALTVALAGTDAAVFAGPASDLDRLEQQAAEHVFASVDPSNYVLYLDATNRDREAYAAVAHLAQTAPDAVSKSGFLSLWAVMTRGVTGDVELANARARYSLALNPKMAVAHRELMVGEHFLGHEERAFQEARVVVLVQESDLPATMRGHGFLEFLGAAQFQRDADMGDFQHARADPCFYCSASDALLYRAEDSAQAHDPGQSRADIAAALATGTVSPAVLSRTRTFVDIAVGDWLAAVADTKAYGDGLMADDRNPRLALLRYRTFAAPLRAYALAHAGDFAQAQKIVDATARDCYHCVRMRGVVDVLQRNWNGAASWFAEAVGQAPSLPFAYADWGEMLMRKGDLGGAVAKFGIAHQKGPHFADPLEMWGEALMAENRSDLALPKFEEASRYAPNWGRLHRKWGEALTYLGRKDEARVQLARAGELHG